ncbi:MAG TPA: Hsp20/alpha crystallin family protein [Candidatus Limnocylindrales bacterium]|nr:Hsp20/alpha crystallin family protein [Candidatus Limnocylindrales bacterium]
MRAMTTWMPGREVAVLHRELDDMINRFFGDANGAAQNGSPTGIQNLKWVPAIESFVRDNQIVVRADLPGIDPSEVDITVEGKRLTIRGERRDQREENQDGRVYREVAYGSFERVLTLPWEADADAVQALYKNGVLEVTIQAPEKVLPKKIAVTTH